MYKRQQVGRADVQDLAHAVQRQIEHIIILEVAADVGHEKGRLAVLALLGGVICLFFGLRLLRLGLGGGQLFQLPLRLDLPYSCLLYTSRCV